MKPLLLIALFLFQSSYSQQSIPDYLIYDWDTLIEVFVFDDHSKVIYHYMDTDEMISDSEIISETKKSRIMDELGLPNKFILPLDKMKSVSKTDIFNLNFKLNVFGDAVYFNFLDDESYIVRFFWDDELDEIYKLQFCELTVANLDFIVLRDEYFPGDSLGFICKIGNKFLVLYDDEMKRSKGDDDDTNFNPYMQMVYIED